MEILKLINDFLWTYVLIAMLVLCALYFTLRTRFVQFRMFFHMVKLMFRDKDDTNKQENDQQRIGSFHAFAVALSSRVGTGNLAGVASAICVGGPGAVF